MVRPPSRLRPSILLLALTASLAVAPVAAAQTTDTSTFALANFLGKTSDPRVCADIDIDASRFPEIPGSGSLTTMVFLNIRLFECGESPDNPLGALSGQGGGGFTLRHAKNGKSAHLSGTLTVVEDDFETGQFFPNQVRINLAYHCVSRQARAASHVRASGGSSRATIESFTCDAVATGSIRSPDPETGRQRQFVTGPSVFAMIGRTVTQTVQRD
jgi:hypothetical protein